jgi:hypothetical protein
MSSKDKSVRVNITLPELLYDKACEKARAEGFSGFSDYVQHVIRLDTIYREREDQIRKDIGRRYSKPASEKLTQAEAATGEKPKRRGIDKKDEN